MIVTYEEFIESIRQSRDNTHFDYSERHHIVPRCLGGTEDESNLIYLTLQEHFIAHKLLYEENPEDDRLFYAYWRMCNNGVDIITPEEYERAKMKFISMRQGENHPFYGKRHSEETKKRISDSVRGENNPFYGRHHSEESKSKMSLVMKGRSLNEETRIRLSESLSGRSLSVEHKNNLRASRDKYKGVNHPNYGRIVVNDGSVNKMIRREDLESYMSRGYVVGKIYRNKLSQESFIKRDS